MVPLDFETLRTPPTTQVTDHQTSLDRLYDVLDLSPLGEFQDPSFDILNEIEQSLFDSPPISLSDQPSDLPSDRPSGQPTDRPTDRPTDQPSDQPNNNGPRETGWLTPMDGHLEKLAQLIKSRYPDHQSTDTFFKQDWVLSTCKWMSIYQLNYTFN